MNAISSGVEAVLSCLLQRQPVFAYQSSAQSS